MNCNTFHIYSDVLLEKRCEDKKEKDRNKKKKFPNCFVSHI